MYFTYKTFRRLSIRQFVSVCKLYVSRTTMPISTKLGTKHASVIDKEEFRWYNSDDPTYE